MWIITLISVAPCIQTIIIWMLLFMKQSEKFLTRQVSRRSPSEVNLILYGGVMPNVQQ